MKDTSLKYHNAKIRYLLKFNKLEDLDEQLIATDAQYSIEYADDILGGRFELGEATIATDAGSSYQYALMVLKGRFELGEEAIAKDRFYKTYYNNLLKQRGIHYELQ